jgi:hypothetical protein
MSTLIFFCTLISVVVLFVMIIMNTIRGKNVKKTLLVMVSIITVYALLWFIFYLKSSNTPIDFDTDICFDDWCITVTDMEKVEDIQGVTPKGQFIILYLRLSNHALGIAQKPSEPKIQVVDVKGRKWNYDPKGQTAYEKAFGKQYPVDQKLELHQSLDTQLVFEVPLDAKNLYALIEEGPFITKLLLPVNKKIYTLE